jgi:uncharacterized membrane protein YbaN (DUF454 family)
LWMLSNFIASFFLFASCFIGNRSRVCVLWMLSHSLFQSVCKLWKKDVCMHNALKIFY